MKGLTVQCLMKRHLSQSHRSVWEGCRDVLRYCGKTTLDFFVKSQETTFPSRNRNTVEDNAACASAPSDYNCVLSQEKKNCKLLS